MDFSEAIRTVFLKWRDFDTRASRSEYWWFYALMTAYFGLSGFEDTIDNWENLVANSTSLNLYDWSDTLAEVLTAFIFIFVGFSVGARRLHDIGTSGWWQLLYFVPILGWLILLNWHVREGDTFSNDYGAVPAGRVASERKPTLYERSGDEPTQNLHERVTK